jgi:2'-5' RNA ligase
MGTRWRGLLAPINKPTGDGRRMGPGAVTHRPLPLPLKWQRIDEQGHDTSTVIGLMDKIDIDEQAGEVWAEGEMFDDISPSQMPRLAEDVAEAMTLSRKQVIGPSVDPGSAQAIMVLKGSNTELTPGAMDAAMWASGGVAPETEMLFTAYEIAAATLVPVPAFAQCRPFELGVSDALTAAQVQTSGLAGLPLAPREHPWDGDAAARRLAASCTPEGSDEPDWGCYSDGFLYRYVDRDPNTRGAYGYGVVDVIDGQKVIVPRAVFAVANILSGGRGGGNLPTAAQQGMRTAVETLYGRMAKQFKDPALVAPWANGRAALVAAAAPLPMPDASLFHDPQLAQITPITQRDLGNGWVHVFGHIATHDVCLVGMPGVCTTAPYSDQEYAPFHRYSTTRGGTPLPVAAGRITAAHGEMFDSCRCCRGNDDHACANLSFGAAIGHHDQMRVLAYVCSGEDEANNAIWVSGVRAPEANADDINLLNRKKVSGDWRDMAGSMELVEVLALAKQSPGFPLPRVSVDGRRQRALTAAGVVRPQPGQEGRPVIPQTFSDPLDHAQLGIYIARELARLAAGEPIDDQQTDGQPWALTAAEAHEGAMLALRMTDQDAQRLAVTGGLPPEELHLTVAYLGKAADISPEMCADMIERTRGVAASLPGPIVADGFHVAAFNPGKTNNRDTALVLGVGGNDLAHALGQFDTMELAAPEQHLPRVPHVTLEYSEDLSRLQAMADRVGPVTFDRVRLAFGGEVTDIPIGAIIEQDKEDQVTGQVQTPAGDVTEVFAADSEPDGETAAQPVGEMCAKCDKLGACGECADCLPTDAQFSARALEAAAAIRAAYASRLASQIELQAGQLRARRAAAAVAELKATATK